MSEIPTLPASGGPDGPITNRVIEPGNYLAEINLARPCAEDVLVRGLGKMGWDEIYTDLSVGVAGGGGGVRDTRATSVVKRPPHVRLAGGDRVVRTPRATATAAAVEGGVATDSGRVRFLGQLTRPIMLGVAPHVSWTFAHRFEAWDPYADIMRYTVRYFRLLTDVTYEIRFLVRALPGKSSRDRVEADLRVMGWDPSRLAALKRNMRMPGRSSADVTLWIGLARWDRAKSYITGDDPFYFEDVVPCA